MTGYSDVPVVERMARALCLGYIRDEMFSGHQEHVDSYWQEWIDIAREVLAAMREPTLHMILECGDLPGSIQHDWPRLIDAALSETTT